MGSSVPFSRPSLGPKCQCSRGCKGDQDEFPRFLFCFCCWTTLRTLHQFVLQEVKKSKDASQMITCRMYPGALFARLSLTSNL